MSLKSSSESRKVTVSDPMPIIIPKRKKRGEHRTVDDFADAWVSSDDSLGSDYIQGSSPDSSCSTVTDEEGAVSESEPIRHRHPLTLDEPATLTSEETTTQPSSSIGGGAARETLFRTKSKNSTFLLNVTILSFFIEAFLSLSVVCYCMVWMALSGFDEEVVTYLLPLLSFVLGVWLPNPSELLHRKHKAKEKKKKRRRHRRKRHIKK